MPSIPLIVDSTSAQNKNTLGNRCSVSFSPPLQLPRNCSPSIRLYSASFAYNSPNVSAAFSNNVLTIDRMNVSGAYDHRHHVTFADGLYGSLDDIARVIRHSLHNDANFPNIELTFIPVEATQRVHIEVTNGNSDAILIHFSSNNSIGPLMGFTSDKTFAANATTMHESDTTAALDRTTSVLVQTSLCNGSIVGGTGGQDTLAMVHLAAFSPASIVAYAPNNLLEVPAGSLAGTTVTSASFALVNQAFEDLNMLNEAFQLVIEILY